MEMLPVGKGPLACVMMLEEVTSHCIVPQKATVESHDF